MSEGLKEFNQLPEGYKSDQKRRTKFSSKEKKLEYDAANLIEIAQKQYEREIVTVSEALDYATRHDDDIEGLRRAIAIQIKDRVTSDGRINLQEENTLSDDDKEKLIVTLKARFEPYMTDPTADIKWVDFEAKLNQASTQKLWALNEMDRTGGLPYVTGYYEETDEYELIDCSTDTPSGRRGICYDRKAQRQEEKDGYKPKGNAVDMAAAMGLGGILDENQYLWMQQHIFLDNDTQSWILTPDNVRSQDLALLGSRSFEVFDVDTTSPRNHLDRFGFRGWLRI